MFLLALVQLAFLGLVSKASGGLDCIKNKYCDNKHEHLCNMQGGLWTKNYIVTNRNASYNEILDSCACCFLPDVYRSKLNQKGTLDTIVSMESQAQSFASRMQPCAPLRRACSKTSDCCTGYCSASVHHEGFCNDPLVLKDSQDPLRSLSSESNFTAKKRGHPLYSDLTSSPSTDTTSVTSGIKDSEISGKNTADTNNSKT